MTASQRDRLATLLASTLLLLTGCGGRAAPGTGMHSTDAGPHSTADTGGGTRPDGIVATPDLHIGHPDGPSRPPPDFCSQHTADDCPSGLCYVVTLGCPTCEQPNPRRICQDQGVAGDDAGACPLPVCDCEGLDEVACQQAAPMGCFPFRCPGCAGGPSTFSCLNASDGGVPICPACPGECREQADCGGAICFQPGDGFFCGGTCSSTPPTCNSDADCNDPAAPVCEPDPCSCDPSLSGQCVPGCASSADCAEGETCGADRRCFQTLCQSPMDCPPLFECQATGAGRSVCERKACRLDGDCGQEDSYCVLERCHAQAGHCEGPPPP